MIKKISVIIPTCNPGPEIYSILAVLLNTKCVSEIIVIDSSKKKTHIKTHEKITYIKIDKKDFDHGKTRNIAAKSCSGEILVFLTQDALPINEHSIEKLVSVFDNKVGAAYGRQIPYENTNIFGKHLRLFNYPEKSFVKSLRDKENLGIKTCFLSNSFCAYSKSILDSIGWFPENIPMGEDVYAGSKIILAGYKIYYVAEAQVYHSHSYNLLQEFKRYFMVGAFYKSNKWIFDAFGSSEKEGNKYLISEISFLAKNKKAYLIPLSFIRVIVKYFGYICGKLFYKS